MTGARLLVGFSLLTGLLLAVHLQLEFWVFRLTQVAVCSDLLSALRVSSAPPGERGWILCGVSLFSFLGLALLEDLYGRDPALVTVLITTVQLGDVLQYYLGRGFGRRHIGWLSPRKTVEGYLLAGLILPLVMYLLWEIPFQLTVSWYLLGVAGGALSSLSKRQLGLKDWSALLGSHGGFLDRADSLLLPTCVLWLFLACC